MHREEIDIKNICLEIFEYYGGCDNCVYPICCHQCPTVSNKEIKKLADCMGIGISKFKKKYITKINVPFNSKKIKSPCPFFKDEKCLCYSQRPLLCSLYPFDISHGYVKMEGINLCQTATYIANDIEVFYNKYIKPHTSSEKGNNDEMETALDYIKETFDGEYEDKKLLGISSEMIIMPEVIMVVFYFNKIKKVPVEKLIKE